MSFWNRYGNMLLARGYHCLTPEGGQASPSPGPTDTPCCWSWGGHLQGGDLLLSGCVSGCMSLQVCRWPPQWPLWLSSMPGCPWLYRPTGDGVLAESPQRGIIITAGWAVAPITFLCLIYFLTTQSKMFCKQASVCL